MYNIFPYSLYGVRCWCQSGGGGACFILQAARIQSPLAPPVQKSEQIFDFRTQIHHFLTASHDVTPVTIRPERDKEPQRLKWDPEEPILTQRSWYWAVVLVGCLKLCLMLEHFHFLHSWLLALRPHRKSEKMAATCTDMLQKLHRASTHVRWVFSELISCAFLEALDHFTTIPEGCKKDPS